MASLIPTKAQLGVIAIFELARAQEFTLLQLMRRRGEENTEHQRQRYVASCDVVDALQAYADLQNT